MSVIAQVYPTTGLGGSLGGGKDSGFGPFANIGGEPVQVIKDISTLISNLLAFITIIGGLWFGFQLILGAFQWITSGGDKAGLESARNRMIHAFFGMVLVAGSLALIALIGVFFQLDILLTDPEKISKLISPPK